MNRTQILSILLIQQLIFQPVAQAVRSVDDGEEVDIRACGNFKVMADAEEESTPTVCRVDDRTNDKNWRTRDAEVELHVPKSKLGQAKSPRELIDQLLLEMIREKVKTKFKSYAWMEVLKDEKSDDVKAQKRIEQIKENFEELKKQVLPDEVKNEKMEISRLLTLYPEVEEEILKEHPDYKPLICKFELRKHRQKILKTCAKILSITSALALLVGGPATAYFWIPALPKILAIGAGGELVAGSLKIGHAIGNWDQVKAGNTAQSLLKFDQEIEKLVKRLKKDPVKNKELIRYLQDHRLTSVEIDQLKGIKKLKRKQIKELLGGILNTAFGAAGIYGAIKVGEHFLNFEADQAPNITNSYDGGSGGLGGGSGGMPGMDDGG